MEESDWKIVYLEVDMCSGMKLSVLIWNFVSIFLLFDF